MLTARADVPGARLLFAASGGAWFSWDVARDEVQAVANLLLGDPVWSQGRSSTGVLRWWLVAISSDLTHIAHWVRHESHDGRATYTLRVLRRADGVETLRWSPPQVTNAWALVFHPTKSVLGAFDTNRKIALFDYETGRTILEDGPQANSLSFGPGDTVVFDDWYGAAQRLDYGTGRVDALDKAWGSQASQSDRFVTVNHTGFAVRSLANRHRARTRAFEPLIEGIFSTDGTRLVIWADRLCVWNLGPVGA